MSSAQPGPSRPGAVTAVCCVVAVLALLGAMNSYQTSKAYGNQYPDAYGAARAELRFAPIAARIPANGVIGYITDLDPAGGAFAPAFLAAQYALAPRQVVVIQLQNKPEYAVGNFSKPVDYAAAGATLGYEIAKDEGNGVILFRKKSS